MNDRRKREYCEFCRRAFREQRKCKGCEYAFEPFPENLEPIALWNAVWTQWRTDNGFRIGLDYGAVAVAARALRIRFDHPRVFRGLQILEEECLLDEERESRRKRAPAS